MSKKEVRFIPKLNADFELKLLGNIMGFPIYVDMAKELHDEDKFQKWLMVQKMMADFFNPPEKEQDE